MKSLVAAIRFLTILPLPGTSGTAEDDLAHSVPYFPLVGLLLGVVAAAVAWGLSLAAPPMLTAAVLVIVLMSFSGCLHLDGLSDTADGFLSSRSRERILEIMKDSHTGAMGVTAIVAVLLLKFAALASIPSAALWRAVFLMPLAGRCAMVVAMALLPYVRTSGLAKVFYRKSAAFSAMWAAVFFAGAAWLTLGLAGLAVWGVWLAITLVLAAYAYRKIGGATGDVFGAVCEILEIVPAVALAVWPLGAGR